VVIGGGIFGIYTALHLVKRKISVLLVEKDENLFRRASAINQARLHGGYHYPRSIATARSAQEYMLRFCQEHEFAVNRKFEQYYGIDKTSSYTSPDQFESFCNFLNIPLKSVDIPPYFNKDHLAALFLTQEYSIDLTLLANYYLSKVEQSTHLQVMTQTYIRSVRQLGDSWELEFQSEPDDRSFMIKATSVINATYSSINVINQLFGLGNLDMTHEITEIVLAESSLKDVGLTIVDGDFVSMMPYGHSNLVSLSSVRYTSHYNCSGFYPSFPCQHVIAACRPDDCLTCNDCSQKPASNQLKMIRQIQKYLGMNIELKYLESHYTIKSKLQSSYIDDSRPTLIRKFQEIPEFHCIFGGKLSSIYDIENNF
jgi:hypothetical protein